MLHHVPMPLLPSGFWSYARADDDATDGQVVRLAHRVIKEFRLLTGETLEIFIDRESLNWGEAWEERIDESIHGTTFFIPVITPTYLRSASCRAEFIKFWNKSKYSNLEKLVLPIFFAGVSLNSETDDDVLSNAISRQAEDWRALRLEDENSSYYRKGVHKLAARLRDVAEVVAAQPEISPTPIISDNRNLTGEDEPGLLDRIAQIEERLPVWQKSAVAITDSLRNIAQAMNEPSPEMNQAKHSNSLAARIRAISKLADRLDTPTTNLFTATRQFKDHAVSLDPAFRAIIELSETSSEEDRRSASYLASMLELSRIALNEATNVDDEFRDSLQRASKISRDMRKPALRIIDSLLMIDDTQSILADWIDGFDKAGIPAINPSN